MTLVALIFLLLALLIVIGTLFPGWNFAAGPLLSPNRIIGLIVGLVVLFIVYIVVVALFGGGPVVGRAAAGVGLVALGATTPGPSSDKSPWSYELAYGAAWLNAAVGVVCGVLAAAYLAVHPAWLTQEVAATCGIITTVTLGLATLLPQVTRTPSARVDAYLLAGQGKLPEDLARRYPMVATVTEPPAAHQRL